MGVEDLIKNKEILISDLERGKMYQGELIIERNNSYLNMVTARREGKEIWTSGYHVLSEMGKVKLIILDGGQEYSPEDREYEELNKMLEKTA